MTLIVDELYPGVVFEQKFRIKRSMQLAHLRPWIYKHGTPTGTMNLEVYSGVTKLQTVTIEASTINEAISGTYAHGYVRFDFPALQLNHDSKSEWTEYTVKLFVTGHTKDSANFFGAIRRYENPVYSYYDSDPDFTGELPNSMIAPLGFELYKVGY